MKLVQRFRKPPKLFSRVDATAFASILDQGQLPKATVRYRPVNLFGEGWLAG